MRTGSARRPAALEVHSNVAGGQGASPDGALTSASSPAVAIKRPALSRATALTRSWLWGAGGSRGMNRSAKGLTFCCGTAAGEGQPREQPMPHSRALACQPPEGIKSG